MGCNDLFVLRLSGQRVFFSSFRIKFASVWMLSIHDDLHGEILSLCSNSGCELRDALQNHGDRF